MIKSYAKKAIAHAAANGGGCRPGFVKELVDKAAQVAPLLKITCDDINNRVRNIRGPCKQQEVSRAIPHHAIGCPTLFHQFGLKHFHWFDFPENKCGHRTICCPTLSTDSDSSVSAGLIFGRTSVENPSIGCPTVSVDLDWSISAGLISAITNAENC